MILFIVWWFVACVVLAFVGVTIYQIVKGYYELFQMIYKWATKGV
jgi:hypothetical protein